MGRHARSPGARERGRTHLLGGTATAYTEAVLFLPEMVEWTALAEQEQDDVEELEMEF